MFEDYIKETLTDYKKEVLRAYLKRKEGHELPRDLAAPNVSCKIIADTC